MEQELLLGIFKSKISIEQYKNLLNSKNNITDEWLKLFTKYYRLRMSFKETKKCYEAFDKLEDMDKQNFEKVLKCMTGCKKAFASKMMTMFSTEMPILDKNVTVVFNGKDNLDVFEKTVVFYNGLTKWYKDYLKTNVCQQYISWFDTIFRDNKISNYKKVDYLLWVIGGISDIEVRNNLKEKFAIEKWGR